MTAEDIAKEKRQERVFWTLAGIALFCCAMAILSPFALWLVGKCVADTGQIGDSFGLANAFVSFFAFSMLIYNSYLQRKDLNNQDEQIREQMKLMVRQIDVMSGQQKQMESQSIEMKKSHSIQLTGQYFNLLTQRKFRSDLDEAQTMNRIELLTNHLAGYVTTFLQDTVEIDNVMTVIMQMLMAVQVIRERQVNHSGDIVTALSDAVQKASHFQKCKFTDNRDVGCMLNPVLFNIERYCLKAIMDSHTNNQLRPSLITDLEEFVVQLMASYRLYEQQSLESQLDSSVD